MDLKQIILFLSFLLPCIILAQEPTGGKILAYWTLDSINHKGELPDKVREEMSFVDGNWDFYNGVRGRSIKLDGYTTRIESNVIPGRIFNEFSISAWVALQSYPWNLSPIVNQGRLLTEIPGSVPEKDFFLGIDAYGRTVFEVKGEDSLYRCISSESLPLLRWVHLTGTFTVDDGLKIFINGQLAGEEKNVPGSARFSGDELLLGMNLEEMAPIGSERTASENILSKMVLHGLMDEVKIYDMELGENEILSDYHASIPGNKQPLKYEKLPSGPSNPFKHFGAYYTRLNYTEEWEDHWRVGEFSDILVHFEKTPVRYLFWRGTGYGGVWVSENGIWMADQSLERVGRNKSPLGCAEHMSDKQTRYSRVRIIEKNDARVVIHWRYAVSDILYNIFGSSRVTDWGEWADEYYYIYPDGISTRYQLLHSDHLSHEWQETIVINQAGTFPEDNIQTEAMVLANMKGETKTYTWENGPPQSFSGLENGVIQMVNLRSRYKPFIIFEPGAGIKPFRGAVRPEYSMFPWWNHWPVAQIPNDGRKAFAPDRPSHSSLSQSIEGSKVIHESKTGNYWAVSLTGMTNSSIQDLVPLAKSWNSPPNIISLSKNTKFRGYSKKERAYQLYFKNSVDKEIRFELEGSSYTPIYNPVFIIDNLPAKDLEIFINQKRVDQGKDYFKGLLENGDESKAIIWIDLKSEQVNKFSIRLL